MDSNMNTDATGGTSEQKKLTRSEGEKKNMDEISQGIVESFRLNTSFHYVNVTDRPL